MCQTQGPLSCGPCTSLAAPPSSLPPPCLSSRYQRGLNSSVQFCASLCSHGESCHCPPSQKAAAEDDRTPPTDPAPLCAATASPLLCLLWSQNSAADSSPPPNPALSSFHHHPQLLSSSNRRKDGKRLASDGGGGSGHLVTDITGPLRATIMLMRPTLNLGLTSLAYYICRLTCSVKKIVDSDRLHYELDSGGQPPQEGEAQDIEKANQCLA